MNDTDHPNSANRNNNLLSWLATYPKTVIAISTLLLLLLFAILFDYGAKRSLADRITAIKQRGDPVTLEDLVARSTGVLDQNGTMAKLVALGEAMKAVKIPEDKVKQLPLIGFARVAPTGQHLGNADLQTSRWYLSQVEQQLKSAQHTLPKESLHYKAELGLVSCPQLSSYFMLAKTFKLYALIKADEGNANEAYQALSDEARLPLMLNGAGNGVVAFTQLGLNGASADSAERVINLVSLSEEKLARLQSRFHEQEKLADWHDTLLAERVLLVESLKPNHPTLYGAFTSRTPPSSHSVRSVALLDNSALLAAYALVLRIPLEPAAPAMESVKTLETKIPWYCTLTRVTFRSMPYTIGLWARSVGAARAIQAAIAAERFRLQTGHWPPSLQTLVPKFINAVPLDPVDGKPIRYAQIAEGIKVWTIGDNDQNKDDGGDIHRLDNGRPKDWGWLLLNPNLRGRPASTQPTK